MTLIDKDALMETIRNNHYPLATRNNSIDNGMFTIGIQQAVDEQPTVDAVEVRHGYWIGPGEYVTTAYGHLDIYQCSECGANITIDDYDSFCPACGCRMDGRRESEDK